MNRIPHSERVREEIAEFMANGLEGTDDVMSFLVRKGAQLLVQEFLEQEVTDFLGRGHYQRRQDGPAGYRNGYETTRIKSAEGIIPVAVPQVRESPIPFQSQLVQFLRGHTEVLKQLVTEMYARGLSTRDIEDALRKIGDERLISRTGVSQLGLQS